MLWKCYLCCIRVDNFQYILNQFGANTVTKYQWNKSLAPKMCWKSAQTARHVYKLCLMQCVTGMKTVVFNLFTNRRNGIPVIKSFSPKCRFPFLLVSPFAPNSALSVVFLVSSTSSYIHLESTYIIILTYKQKQKNTPPMQTSVFTYVFESHAY